jgi:hypothetical protein
MMQPFANINYLCLKQSNMKYTVTFIFFIVLFLSAAAQSRTATVEYQKINRQAVVSEIPFPEKTIRDAIDNKMQQMGYKGKDSKGYTVYKRRKNAGAGQRQLRSVFYGRQKKQERKRKLYPYFNDIERF